MKKFTPYIVTAILVLIIALTGCGGGGVTWPQCFAYVANSGSGNVTAYSINPSTGKLTSIGNIGAGTEPCSIITDPAGNFVYVVNNNSKNISIFSINATNGKLAEISGSPVTTTYKPGAITMNPNPISAYIYAYVANSDASIITPYSTEFYNNSGKLTHINWLNPISCGTSAWSITADPTGKFVYVANRDSNYISAFKSNLSTGALEPIPGSPFPAGTGPYSIIVEPAGKFVYTANWGSNNISAYSINTNGTLTAIGGSPFDNGSANSTPVSITVDPTGRFVYVVNTDSDNVQAYAINATTGALKPVGNPVAAGQWPTSIITVRK